MTTVKISSLRGTGGSGSDISIVGPTTVLAGTTNTYTITDYDDFSTYDVSVNIGTVSRSDETITLVAPSGSGENVIILSISRDNNSRVFQIGLGGVGVATPSITSPANGNTNIPTSLTIQATEFSTVPAGAGVQTASVWQVARDLGFTDIVVDETKTTGNLTQYSVSGLARNTTYYARVKYQSSVGDSSWSSAISFTTTQQQINKPTVSIVGQDFNVGETPTFNSSAFSVTPVGSDTHVASTWIVRRADDDSVVWQVVGSSANKLSITLPRGVLEVSTTYTVEVKHIGGFGESVFSDKLTFTTAQSFIPDEPGTPFGGGYYAGRINVGGQIYALVVAPKSLGGEAPELLSWQVSGTGNTLGTDSRNDGWANTNVMVAAGIANHPAAQFCKGLNIGGYNDWYLPSQDELEILYRNFKPTTLSNSTSSGENPSSVPPTGNYTSGNPEQTSIEVFQQGGAEAFEGVSMPAYRYWSSTKGGSSTPAAIIFNNGYLALTYFSNIQHSVRAVRRVPVS